VESCVFINGEFLPRAEAKISVFDRGFLYGDGIFEGIRAYHGRIFRLQQHLTRLYRGAKAILLEIPMSPAELEAAVAECVRRSGLREAYVRLVVSRGCGDLGLDPRNCHTPATVVVIVDKLALYPEAVYASGLEVITCFTRRNLSAALNPEVKSLNYLNNILAKIEVAKQNADEGLMLNHLGFVAEATGDNVFTVREGRIVTPPVHAGLLEGITRGIVFELAAELKVPLVEEDMTLYQVYSADECFLTGTAAEIVPVRSVDGRQIGDGKPGPITKRLMERFKEVTRTEGVPVT
jgi:branched-chain amino acid aminotransferase